MNLNDLPIRHYLDQTIVPALLKGLTELAKSRLTESYKNNFSRPQDPLQFLSNYLRDYKKNEGGD